MSNSDAIALAAFDDEPGICPPALPGLRPAHRPRPGSSGHPHTEPIALVVVDSDVGSEPAILAEPGRARPRLAVDIGVVDPESALFLVVFAAGTSLDALGPRTITIPSSEAGSPITRLDLHVRKPTEPVPVPFLSFECLKDIRGQHLTLRFSDPTDLRTLAIQYTPTDADRHTGNGPVATARPTGAGGSGVEARLDPTGTAADGGAC